MNVDHEMERKNNAFGPSDYNAPRYPFTIRAVVFIKDQYLYSLNSLYGSLATHFILPESDFNSAVIDIWNNILN